jgi:phytoene synthase
MERATEAAAWCAERARRAPGDWPLIALFAPRPARRAVQALAALLAELDDAIAATHAADLAVPRLEWWRTELASLAEGEPRHPVSRALAASHALTPADVELLEEPIDGALDTLEGARAVDADAWALWRYRTGGAPLALAARFCGSDMDERVAFTLGGELAELAALATLGARARRNWLCLPHDGPAASASPTPEAMRHVATRATGLGESLASHAGLLRGAAPTAAPLWVALALGLQRQRRLVADPARAWRDDGGATGVMRVWHAWRAAVAHS